MRSDERSAKGGDAGEQGGAGELAAAGDDEQPAAILLAGILGDPRQREAGEKRRVDVDRFAHLAPTISSGSAVIGICSSFSGAAKL